MTSNSAPAFSSDPPQNSTLLLRSDDADPPVTVVREIRVKPGHETAFEGLMVKLISEATRQPGHLGATVVRPQMPRHAYRFIYKFDRRTNLQAWHASGIRAQLVAPIAALVEWDRFDQYPGLETWFNLPAAPAADSEARLSLSALERSDHFPSLSRASMRST